MMFFWYDESQIVDLKDSQSAVGKYVVSKKLLPDQDINNIIAGV